MLAMQWQRHPNPSELRRDMRRVMVSGLFGALWIWTITGAALVQFAMAMDMPDWAFGLMASLIHVGALCQLPVTLWMQRYGHRRQLLLIMGLISRLLWVVVALIPWLLGPSARAWWWPSMMVGVAVIWAFHHMSIPPWMTWMADLVPRQVRGRFFGMRRAIGQPVALMATLGAGFVLDWIQTGGYSDENDAMLKIAAAILAIGGIAGAIDLLCYVRMADPSQPSRQPISVAWRTILIEPLKNQGFRWFLGYSFMLVLSLGFLGQYLWLYLLDNIGLNNVQANLLLVALPLLLMWGTSVPWGKLIDRFGIRPVLIIATFLQLTGPIGWLMMEPGAVWLGYLVALPAVVSWPGIELAMLNLMFSLAESERDSSKPSARVANGLADSQTDGQADNVTDSVTESVADKIDAHDTEPSSTRRSPGTANNGYVAVHSVLGAFAGALSGYLGAQVVVLLSDFRWEYPRPAWLGSSQAATDAVNSAGEIVGSVGGDVGGVGGVGGGTGVLTYHGVLLIISCVIRVGAVAMAFKLPQTKSAEVRDTIRYMTVSVYSNARQALLTPTRAMGSFGKVTYRLSRRSTRIL